MSPRRRRSLAALLALGVTFAAGLGCTSDAQKRDEHLAQAEEYREAGKFREARIELRSALRLDPQNPEISYRMAELSWERGALADALFYYRETKRLDPERAQAATREAEIVMIDDPEEAAALIAATIERHPDHAPAHVVRSKIELVRNDADAALQYALTAVKLAPEDGAAAQQLGKVQQARLRVARLAGREPGDEIFEAAIAAFARASELSDPGFEWLGLVEQARVYSTWPGHAEEADAAFREAIAAAEESGAARALEITTGSAIAYARDTGRSELLRAALESRVETMPETYWAWSTLARLEERRGGDPQAVLGRMLEARPEDPQADIRYARELANRGRLDDGLAHLEGLGDDPQKGPAALGAAVDLLLASLRIEEATRFIERLEREFPESWRTAVARAQLALAEGRLEEAADQMQALLETRESPVAWFTLASIQRRLGDNVAALESVERSIELGRAVNFNLEAPFRLMAAIQNSLGDCPKALRTYRALRENGADPLPAELVVQSRCWYALDRPRMGRQILEQVLAMPRPPAEAALAFVKLEGKAEPERAREILEDAARTNPGDPRLVLTLAQLELAAKRPAQALAYLNATVQRGSATPPVLLERARVLAVLGQMQSAERDALQAFEAQPSLPGGAAFLVALYRSQDREAEAIRSFEEAYGVGALGAPAQYLLARLHTEAGNRERARELLESILAERSDIPAAKNDLAYFLAKEGEDLDRAQRLAQEAAQGLAEAPAVADTLGFVFLKRGLYRPALDQFDRALQLGGGSETPFPVLHFHRGLALQGLDRREEAAQAFQAALALDADFREAAEALEGLEAGTEDVEAASSS